MAEYIALCAKDNVNVGRLPSAGVYAYASGGAHAVGCRF